MYVLELWAEGLAGTGWVYLVMYLFAVVDGFFPPIPSESLVIALVTVAVATGRPSLWGVLAAAAAGAFTGDQIAYQIGRAVPVRRLAIFRGPRGRATLGWAEHALAHRGASFIIAARYVPVGRVAVNMSAGALHYRRRRFVPVVAVAAVLWAAWSAVIGLTAGAVLGHDPLLAVAVGVVAGLLLGLLVDRVMRLVAPAGRPTATPTGTARPRSGPDRTAPDRTGPDAAIGDGCTPDDPAPAAVRP